jgi:hypothetical protein
VKSARCAFCGLESSEEAKAEVRANMEVEVEFMIGGWVVMAEAWAHRLVQVVV